MVIYAALLTALRVFGKREVGQFTLFDLVLVLLVANAVQPAMTGPDSSLVGGLIIIASLIGANFIVGRLDRFEFFHRLFNAPPTVLVEDGRLVADACRREGVDRGELEMATREHGLEALEDVKLAVLESDGSISIVGKDETAVTRRRRPRRRYRPNR